MKKLLSIFLAAFTAAALFMLTSCGESGNDDDSDREGDERVADAGDDSGNVNGDVKLENGDTYAVMDIRGFGEITLKLFPGCAPVAVDNFIELAESGYYDGKVIHRIMQNFMIQGGSPFGDGMSAPDYDNYFSIEPHPNAIHSYGALSMANAGPDRNSQQFFIVNNPGGAHNLDGGYTVFGHTVDGFDVLDAVSAVEVEFSDSGEMSKPVDEVVIESVTIHTYEE